MVEIDAQQLRAYDEHRRQMLERTVTPGAAAEADFITVTTSADGRHVARLPLPHKAYFSAAILGMMAGEVFETVITTKFANGEAKWRVVGANDYGVLVAERIVEPAGGAVTGSDA
jgi:hypothetical protein